MPSTWACYSGLNYGERGAPLRDELQSDHACQNENYAEQSDRRGGLAQHRDSQNRGACRADTRPDRIGGSHRQCPERERKKKDARQAGTDGKQRRHPLRKAFRLLHPEGERDFNNAGNTKECPCHVIVPFI